MQELILEDMHRLHKFFMHYKTDCSNSYSVYSHLQKFKTTSKVSII